MDFDFLRIRKRRRSWVTDSLAPSPGPSSVASKDDEHCSSQMSENKRRDYVNRCLGYDRWVWKASLLARLLNALLIQTYFNPDEHWQSLEVAHRLVFGYGHLTWEWHKAIRSYLHPLIFAALYKVLAVTGFDNSWFMAKGPRLLQGVFAACCDVHLFKLTTRVFGHRAAYWALFSQMINWFNFFCLTRTLSNSLETTLTMVALYYWPDGKSSKIDWLTPWMTSRQLALIVAGISCALRPTSAVIWLYVGVFHFYQTEDRFRFVLLEVLPIGTACLVFTAFVDRVFYGYWTVVPFNFLKFNLFSSGGDYYGTHPWHWYFSQGFPVMVFTFLPLTIWGIWKSGRWQYAGLVCWVLTVYSLLGHKEFRFVLPCLPLTMMFAGYALESLEGQCGRRSNETRVPTTLREFKEADGLREPSADPLPVESSNRHSAKTSFRSFARLWWTLMFLCATNIPVALYTSLTHQRGGEAVMLYLAQGAQKNRIESVLFLMPCHSTPFYASLHKNIPMRFLDCSPSDQEDYIDEADRFRLQPMQFLDTMFTNDNDLSQLPSHIVLYDSMESKITAFLRRHSYRLERRFFHSHVPVDRELQSSVLVYVLCRDSQSLLR